MRAALSAIALIVATAISQAGTLSTPLYTVIVEPRCTEGHVTCDDVKCVGVSNKSGKSITLTGKTVHTTGADGVTPSRFMGYTFRNGDTTYFVSEGGELRVTRGSKVLVQERGIWRW